MREENHIVLPCHVPNSGSKWPCSFVLQVAGLDPSQTHILVSKQLLDAQVQLDPMGLKTEVQMGLKRSKGSRASQSNPRCCLVPSNVGLRQQGAERAITLTRWACPCLMGG